MWTKNCIILLAFLVACGAYEVPETVKALGWDTLDFQQLQTPADLAFGLSDDECEDYLNFWLQKKMESSEENTIFQEDIQSRAPCSVNVTTFSCSQPVYVSGGTLLTPSDNSGNINLLDKQLVTMACPGSSLSHTSVNTHPVKADFLCTGGNLVSASSWLTGAVDIRTVNCKPPSLSTDVKGANCVDGGYNINVGLTVDSQIHTIFTSCFHQDNAEVFYVVYDQNPGNAMNAPAGRPSFRQGAFFPGLSVDTLYSPDSQKKAFDAILGSGAANKYINTTYFLSRGHLAAKADFVFSPAQRATFTFVNVAPQWNIFNSGNWNILEQTLRQRIGAANAKTTIYTGTFGNLELENMSTPGVLKKIYLGPGTKIPVPLWFYKVVHEASTGKATAFLGLNNPYVTLEQAKALAFCTDRCAGNSAFSWLNWKNTNITLGYSICCNIADFRTTVTRLPAFTANGGLFS